MGVHESKTTHMQVDIFFFQKFLLVKAAKLTTLFNQPVKSLFISELTVLSVTHTLPEAWLLRPRNWTRSVS